MRFRMSCQMIATGLAAALAGCAGGDDRRAAATPADDPGLADGAAAAPPEATRESDAASLLPNGRHPFPDVITGGQPSTEQLEAAAARGYRTIIDLRPAAEGGRSAEEAVRLGLRYVAIPVAGEDGLTDDNARALATALGEAERPAIVHCASGNRVGALFALVAYRVEGRSAGEALEIGRAAGLTRLEPAVRERLGLPRSP